MSEENLTPEQMSALITHLTNEVTELRIELDAVKRSLVPVRTIIEYPTRPVSWEPYIRAIRVAFDKDARTERLINSGL